MIYKPIPQATLHRLQNGCFVGKPPFGYKVLDPYKKRAVRKKYKSAGTIVIIEHERDIIIDIFTTYTAGTYSIKNLTSYIQKKHCCTIYSAQVHRIIKNKFYYGYFTYNGHEFKHNYPTIISKELFDAAQETRSKNNRYSLHASKTNDKAKPTTVKSTLRLPQGKFSLEDLIEINDMPVAELRKELFKMWKDKKIREIDINIWELVEI